MKGRPVRDGDACACAGQRGGQAPGLDERAVPLGTATASTWRSTAARTWAASMKGRPVRDGDSERHILSRQRVDASMKSRPVRDGDPNLVASATYLFAWPR